MVCCGCKYFDASTNESDLEAFAESRTRVYRSQSVFEVVRAAKAMLRLWLQVLIVRQADHIDARLLAVLQASTYELLLQGEQTS